MNLAQIKAAIAEGKTVHWSNELYVVEGKDLNNLSIVCTSNNHTIGLTWLDGETLNGKEEDFFIPKNINGHNLYLLRDFTKEEFQGENNLALMVLEGLDICKRCGEYESGLDNPCLKNNTTEG
tara:strand:+ start:256 stop:624 length:369 start_codon:yes stop_codon:yes gene_type:complete